MIIGFHGKKRVGKNAAAAYLVEQYGFIELSFAAPLARMVQAMMPLPRAAYYVDHPNERIPEFGKTYTELRQLLGTEWGRNMIHENVWVDILCRDITCRDRWKRLDFVVTDVRYQNEADALLRLRGEIVFVVGSRGIVVNDHTSEIPLPEKYKAYELRNDGDLEELYGNVDAMVAKLR